MKPKTLILTLDLVCLALVALNLIFHSDLALISAVIVMVVRVVIAYRHKTGSKK